MGHPDTRTGRVWKFFSFFPFFLFGERSSSGVAKQMGRICLVVDLPTRETDREAGYQKQ